MKSRNHIYSAAALIVFAILFIASAAEKQFFQLYNTNPVNGIIGENNIRFEDENCQVYYNLWGEGGNIGFSIYNKTDEDIIINMDKSFFVMNDISYDYYQDRVFTRSTKVTTTKTAASYYYIYYSTSGTTTSSYDVSYNEKRGIVVPPKTYKHISEYSITSDYFSSCDLLRFPAKNQTKAINFTEDTSPYKFYNIINYTLNSEDIQLENRFYVSSIKNLPAKEMYRTIYPEYCGEKLKRSVKVTNEKSPYSFYIEYTKKDYDPNY